MAGIFGCFRFKGDGDFRQISQILQQNSNYGVSDESRSGSYNAEHIYLGFERTINGDGRAALLQSKDSQFSLLLFGEMFLPSGELLSAKNFEEEFLIGYERLGNNYFLQCDGAFVLAYYDQHKNSISLITDAFGNVALYYATHQGLLLFSTRQSAIARSIGQKGISEQAIIEVLSLGQRLGGRTLYENIYRIPPGSCLLVIDEVTINKYYVSDYSSSTLNKKELLPKIEESILRSVDIRLRQEGVICGLTGGLDSRITLAAIKRLGKVDRITTFTHGLPQSGDMKIAAQISKLYNIPHMQLPFDNDFFAELHHHWREVVRISEGGLGLENALNILSWKKQSQEFSVSMDSHGGPLYRRQIFKSREGILKRSNNFANTFFKFFSPAILHSGFLRPDVKEIASKIGADGIDKYFSELPEGLKAGDKVDLFYLEEMCANRYSLESNTQLQYIGLSHPLLSLQAYDWATKIPSEKRKANMIYKYLFNRFAPELKNILVDNSGYAVPYYGYRTLRYAPQALEKLLVILLGKSPRLTLRRPIATYEILLQKNIGPFRELLLDTDNSGGKYFIRENIEMALVEFEKTGSHALELLQTANIYLLLEIFGARS